MKEIWKDIPGFKDYSVSNLGRVKSNRFDNIMTATKRKADGYMCVKIRENKKPSVKLVHRLVAMAFLNKVSNHQYHIDHINDDKTDNRLCNLQYISSRANSVKRVGSEYPGAYLTPPSKKWKAQIYKNGRVNYLGYYDTQQLAHEAYLKAMPI